MTTLIVLLAVVALPLLVIARTIRNALDPPASIQIDRPEREAKAIETMAVGRRSLVSLPRWGSPLRSPRLAPVASAEPS